MAVIAAGIILGEFSEGRNTGNAALIIGGKVEGNSREAILAWSIAWEGCLSLNKCQRSKGKAFQVVPMVSLDSTNRELLDEFHRLVGYGQVYTHRRYKNGWWCCYKWQVTSWNNTLRFCQEILPYLPAKVEQARILIEMAERRLGAKHKAFKGIYRRGGGNSYTGEDLLAVERMHQLNLRGKGYKNAEVTDGDKPTSRSEAIVGL